VYGGTTTSTSYGVNDGKNRISFGPLSGEALAQNTFWYNSSSGEILDSDIRLNTAYAWNTNGSSSGFDVQNACTHELGHSLSLDDLYGSGDSEKTMYGYIAAGETKKRHWLRMMRQGSAICIPSLEWNMPWGYTRWGKAV
jgi:hypothetical protein